MNESFKTDPSLATSARAAKESGSYLCASNVTPTAVRFIVSVFLCVLCFCRMSSTQMTCSHFRKNRPKKRQKPAGCRSRIISKNRPVPIFGRSTGASLVFWWHILHLNTIKAHYVGADSLVVSASTCNATVLCSDPNSIPASKPFADPAPLSPPLVWNIFN